MPRAGSGTARSPISRPAMSGSAPRRRRPRRSANERDRFDPHQRNRASSSERTTMLDRALILITAAMAIALTMSSARAFDETKYPDWAGLWTKAPDNGPPRY